MKKFVAVLNPAFSTPTLLNAVGHSLLGISEQVKKEALGLRTFEDAAGIALGSLTDHSLIILRASRQSHLMRLVKEAKECSDIALTAFLDEHRSPDPEAQQARIASRETSAADIACVAVFGNADVINPLTKRFSLFS